MLKKFFIFFILICSIVCYAEEDAFLFGDDQIIVEEPIIEEEEILEEIEEEEIVKEEEEVIEEPQFNVWLTTTRKSVMEVGEPVYIYVHLEGFEGYETLIVWHCDHKDGNGFQLIEGWNEMYYSFPASKETLWWDWQVTVYYR